MSNLASSPRVCSGRSRTRRCDHATRSSSEGVARARWREPHILFVYTIKVAMHYHFEALASALGQAKGPNGIMPNAGRSFSRIKQVVEKERAVAKDRAVEKERVVA